ncbi:unnamed protein product, partial [marine sediment metagenome]
PIIITTNSRKNPPFLTKLLAISNKNRVGAGKLALPSLISDKTSTNVGTMNIARPDIIKNAQSRTTNG